MKTGLRIVALAMGLGCLFQAEAQSGDSTFPKGELSTAKNHTGNIWLNELVVGDSTFDPSIAVATYMLAQSWIGISIPPDRFCSLPKALAITRRRASRRESFAKAM